MTLQQLEYIVALDYERGFVKAANRMFVSQPTLTMQVKKLEEEVGFLIFDRSAKPLASTRLGEQFLQKARHIIREVKELKAMVSHETETVAGEYKIGIIPTLAPYLIPRFLPGFANAYQDIRMNILEMQSEHLIRDIKNDQLDIGIMATPTGERQIREIPLFNEPFLGFFPKGHPLLKNELINPVELDIDDILLLDEGHCFRNQSLHICKKENKQVQHKNPIEFHTGSIETLKKLVLNGMGYTLVPELSVLDDKKNTGSFKRFHEPEPSREISMIVHNSFSRERMIEVLRNAIISNIPDHFTKKQQYIRVKWR